MAAVKKNLVYAPERLRRLRRLAYLTQAELAERLGLTRVTVAGWEQGRRGISHDSARRLADLYRVPVECLRRNGPPLPKSPIQVRTDERERISIPLVIATLLRYHRASRSRTLEGLLAHFLGEAAVRGLMPTDRELAWAEGEIHKQAAVPPEKTGQA